MFKPKTIISPSSSQKLTTIFRLEAWILWNMLMDFVCWTISLALGGVLNYKQRSPLQITFFYNCPTLPPSTKSTLSCSTCLVKWFPKCSKGWSLVALFDLTKATIMMVYLPACSGIRTKTEWMWKQKVARWNCEIQQCHPGESLKARSPATQNHRKNLYLMSDVT